MKQSLDWLIDVERSIPLGTKGAVVADALRALDEVANQHGAGAPVTYRQRMLAALDRFERVPFSSVIETTTRLRTAVGTMETVTAAGGDRAAPSGARPTGGVTAVLQYLPQLAQVDAETLEATRELLVAAGAYLTQTDALLTTLRDQLVAQGDNTLVADQQSLADNFARLEALLRRVTGERRLPLSRAGRRPGSATEPGQHTARRRGERTSGWRRATPVRATRATEHARRPRPWPRPGDRAVRSRPRLAAGRPAVPDPRRRPPASGAGTRPPDHPGARLQEAQPSGRPARRSGQGAADPHGGDRRRVRGRSGEHPQGRRRGNVHVLGPTAGVRAETCPASPGRCLGGARRPYLAGGGR